MPADSIRIPVGPGPEDMVLDRRHGNRLIVACSRRRRGQHAQSGFFAVDTAANTAGPLPDTGPEIDAHGIDLVDTGDSTLLYVVSHRVGTEKRETILAYKVGPSRLDYLGELGGAEREPHLPAPNDVAALPDGTVFVTNTYGMSPLRWLLKRSSVARFKPDGAGSLSGTWSTVENKRARFANGIIAVGGKLFVANSTTGTVLEYRITGDQEIEYVTTPIARLRTPDNFSLHHPSGDLLLAGHVSSLRFFLNGLKQSISSPSVAYRIDPTTGRCREIYRTAGVDLSAGSTALLHNGWLYFGQVFEDYVWGVRESKLTDTECGG